MKKYNLQSQYSDFIQIIFYAMSIQFLGFLIYAFYILEVGLIIFMILMGLFFYFKFLRRGLRYRNVQFDKDYIYYSNKQIALQQINKLKPGKITLVEEGKERIVYYNNLFGSNSDLLQEFIEQRKLR